MNKAQAEFFIQALYEPIEKIDNMYHLVKTNVE